MLEFLDFATYVYENDTQDYFVLDDHISIYVEREEDYLIIDFFVHETGETLLKFNVKDIYKGEYYVE